MDSEITSAMDTYYKLKQKYELTLQRKKQKIMANQSLSTKAKQKKIQEIKKTCINCGNKGGTIFKNTDHTLIAVCGSTEPCNLNIMIRRGYYSNIRTECYNLYEKVNEIQTKIISTKLNILFSYIGEEDAIKEFKKLRKDLSSVVKLYNVVRKEYLNIVTRGIDSPQLKEKQEKLLLAMTELHELSKTYDEKEDSLEPRDKLLTDMVEKYISDILPTVTKIRNLTYIDSRIENVSLTNNNSQTDIIKLIQEPYTIKELYISGLEKAQIINNISSS